ncbi:MULTISPECIES: endolytic transglycosylase MltG [unclassified Streptomyces]|uniref:endolytic transglycosylase MltG n=1 Tax=unclassified Streptomyces TaxID=2593676 RepID=UPI00381EB78C
MSRPRLTRRGRLVVMVTGALAAVSAVLVPVSVLTGGDGGGRPTALTIPEGLRAVQVYESVDRILDVPAGTTRDTVAAARLGLPKSARGNPEGFLFPATYPIDATTTPAGLLTYMVTTAHQRFAPGGGTAAPDAKSGGAPAGTADPALYRTITIASIVQAEAATAADMGKVARVVHNRLALDMPLQMDSTVNYALNRSTLDTSHADTKTNSPYNTYEHKGLPPTPIGNPGEEAMKAALHPTPGDWLYFVTVKPGDTRFTHRYAEHHENVQEFNRNRGGDAKS